MRYRALFVAALVVVGAGIPLAAAAPSETGSTNQASVQEDDSSGNETANASSPGAQLASVVNVQGAEVEGALAERSFGLQVAAAKSNASKAAVIANQSGELSTRIAELRDRKEALLEAKQNGSISQARFRAEMAGLAAELSTQNRLLNRTTGEAGTLPASVLAEQGVNATALMELHQAVGNLSGPQISQIAQNISGPSMNVSIGSPGNISVGGPGNISVGGPGNVTVGSPGEDDDDGLLDDEEDDETTTTSLVDDTTTTVTVNTTLASTSQ